MNRDAGESDFIGRYLQGRRTRAIVTGALLAIVGIGAGVVVALDPVFSRSPRTDQVVSFALPFLPGALAIGVVVRKLVEMFVPLWRQPAGVALWRHGEPQQVLADVNAEMGATTGVIWIGGRSMSNGFSPDYPYSPYSAEVYLTPSWLVCFVGIRVDRLAVFRLADVVSVARIRPPWKHLLTYPFDRHTWVTVLDRHGVRLNMLLVTASATRLLAEVLARVPWAVSHFGAATPHDADADLSRFIAEVDRRREELRVTGQTPPTSPS